MGEERHHMRFILFLLLLLVLLSWHEYQFRQRTLRRVKAQQLLLCEKDKLLREKDLHIREFNHRVKNNLTIIINLLESQSRYLDNPAVQAALRDTLNRVHAVFLLHQRLYGAAAGSEVDASPYVTELVHHLSEMFDTENNGIIITQKIDPVSVSIDAAKMLPLGVIINETVTNAIKHAFPAGRKGRIHLVLNKDGSGIVRLQVRDNGVGLPSQLRPDADHSLGLTLIKGLVGQVQGSWAIKNDDGVIVSVEFPFRHPTKRARQGTISMAV
jgi:two-component sensor histidine kinase